MNSRGLAPRRFGSIFWGGAFVPQMGVFAPDITRGLLAKKKDAKTKHPKKDIKVSAKVLRKCSANSLILLWHSKSA